MGIFTVTVIYRVPYFQSTCHHHFSERLLMTGCIMTWTCWQLYSYRQFTLEPDISPWLMTQVIC